MPNIKFIFLFVILSIFKISFELKPSVTVSYSYDISCFEIDSYDEDLFLLNK